MDHDRDLPEGVIDADPPGGWESGAAADGETAAQNADAQGDARLAESGESGTAPAGAEPSDPVESDAPGQGADPDLSPDEE